MHILRVENVTKRYEGHTALDNVSLAIPTGSIYGLLGPNGAGKTTLIRIINRITAPDSGRVFFDGHPLSSKDVALMGYLPEERGLYKKMKVGEQALFFARLKGMSKREATAKLREWFRKFGIDDWWDRKVEELSKGMAQKVQFIVTVLHEPRLLILDEPFSGFDPINADMLKAEILSIRDKGATVIFSTHNMASVEEICDDITLISRSRNILSGPVESVRHSFGENLYHLEFSGDADMLRARLGGAAQLTDHGSTPNGHSSARLELREGESVRDIISLINSSVDIHSFRETVPGMNDIFIKAVSGDKQ